MAMGKSAAVGERTRRWAPDWDCLILFLLGAGTAFNVSFVGQLTGTDLLSVIIAPIVIVRRGGMPIGRATLSLLAMGLLWLLSAVITDLYRTTAPTDYLRGWAKIFFFLAELVTIIFVSRLRLSALLYFAAGVTVATLYVAVANPTDEILADPWKFAFGGVLTMTCILIASSGAGPQWFRTWGRYVLIFAAASADLLHNSRSAFGVTAVAACLAIAVQFMVSRGLGRASPARLFVLAAVAVAIGAGVVAGYSALAGNGALGPQAREKYLAQAGGGAGVILGGRSESLVSFEVIASSPLLGQGSWARSREYAMELVNLRRARGIAASDQVSRDYIPSHSHILGAWVEHGLLGAVFWLAAIWLILRAAAGLGATPVQYMPFVAYLLVGLLWDIPFSPFGTATRSSAALGLAAVIAVLRYARLDRMAAAAGPKERGAGAAAPTTGRTLRKASS